ncbi:MAG: CerR family C-terminal domain-containing protein [Syntrophales bacterium]|jgi:AcrR family transcriptional regulator|nr:CerR family C-terminal domain-containing protein [Syntrophales bacterium]MCK9527661.1 CerR family C-terminal domain-containing protein [Syntrophales bacterium]MDX9922279.1 CerR family C-terminal domain-containing protein [Syntrophales bacterium]
MRIDRADGVETRRKLLDAAGVLFAEKGYHTTKTSDICAAAGANVAALHYHFGSKEKMYALTWQHEFDKSIAKYPPDGGVSPEASAVERLRGHTKALVQRSMDPESRDFDIARREMSNPTGLLSRAITVAMEPLRKMHLELIRAILGPDAAEQDVQLCAMSVHAQCVGALMQARQRRMAAKELTPSPPPMPRFSAEVLTDHIVRFSMAGLLAVRAKQDAH